MARPTNERPAHGRKSDRLADGEDSPVSSPELERVMQQVPRGAFAVAGIAVALLVVGYLYVYLFVFLPRGMVG